MNAPSHPMNKVNFVRFAPSKHSPVEEIAVVDMTWPLVRAWQNVVQPMIRTTPGRADQTWNWFVRYSIYLAAPTRLSSFCIVAAGTGGAQVPIGMLLLHRNYGWLPDRTKRAANVWCFAAAPQAAQSALGVKPGIMLGRALLDTAVVASFNSGNDGRVNVRARRGRGSDTNSAAALARLLERAPLTRLPRHVALQGRFGPFANDGTFFYTGEGAAKAFLYPWDFLR